MENNTQLLKGILEFCVLKLISREPTYGYEIVMHLKQVGFSDLSKVHSIRCYCGWNSRERSRWNADPPPRDRAGNTTL